MSDFLALKGTELIAQVTSGPPEERRYKTAFVDNERVTTDWSATLTVIAHS